MAQIDEQGRTEPPLAADELASLTGFLDYQRQTLEWKCRALGADGLRATTASSSMTLGGLLKHMALVEDIWFSVRLFGREPAEPWASVDWQADHDWEFSSSVADDPDRLRELWHTSVERSREYLTEALADGGLNRVAVRGWADGSAPSLRWIMLHMIEEYARHVGHADLLRESVDGQTGE